MFNAPQARSRLYTTPSAYGKCLAAAFGRGKTKAELDKFERSLEELYPNSRAIAVPMARVGIYLTLKHLIRKGQKVILSPYTISDVVNMVLCAGGIPLFADIEKGGTYNIDADVVEALLSEHDDVGAVLATHFYGFACDILRIVRACDKRGIPVIEDAAQAFGTRIGGRPAGTIGRAGVFSFGLLKNVTSFVGGAVLTSDAALEAKIRRELEDFSAFPSGFIMKKMLKGIVFDVATFPPIFSTVVYWLFRYAYLHDFAFFKNKLDTDANPKCYMSFPAHYARQMWEAQGQVIRDQLVGYERDTAERIETARMYQEGLKDVPGLVLPPSRADGSHIYLYYSIQCENRDKLALWMTRKLRDVQISHHRNCASMPCFSAYFRDCPNAEQAARNVIYLPTYPGYGKNQVTANIEVIRSFFREANSWT